MSQTISDDYINIKHSFLTGAYSIIPGYSELEHLGTAHSTKEKWSTWHNFRYYTREKISFNTSTSNVEAWMKMNKKLVQDFHITINELIQQLSNERRVKVKYDDEVILFCADQSLIKYLNITEDLIKKHFPVVNIIHFSIEYDPETSDKWISADIKVSGEINQVIEWEDNYIKELVNSIPYPERDNFRLSCDII